VIYLAAIAVCSVLLGLAVDQVYATLGISAKAAAGQAAEIFPLGVQWAAAVAVVAISVKPTVQKLKSMIEKKVPAPAAAAVKKESVAPADGAPAAGDCLPSGPSCSGAT
jgi:hypothetical protein